MSESSSVSGILCRRLFYKKSEKLVKQKQLLGPQLGK